MKKIVQDLSNKILVATPLRLAKGLFYESVIYVLSHAPNGSIGLILNNPADDINLETILTNLGITLDKMPQNNLKLPTYTGGPNDPTRGFVIHSDDYTQNILCNLPCGGSISSNKKILQDIYLGKGPKKSMFILGHTIWQAGEMEEEINNDLWLVLEPNKDLIFRENKEELWPEALKMLELDYNNFSSKTASG